MKWIKSAGGPLICVELDLAGLWLGVHGNSLLGSAADSNATDYDRACEVSTYIGKIQIGDRSAMILGDMPMETAIWIPPLKLPSIVRVVYKDPDADIWAVLTKFGSLDSVAAVEKMPFQVVSGEMTLFDSACTASEISRATSLALRLPKNDYEVRTLAFEPDERTAVVVHEFAIARLH